jgi:hypothetical protein
MFSAIEKQMSANGVKLPIVCDESVMSEKVIYMHYMYVIYIYIYIYKYIYTYKSVMLRNVLYMFYICNIFM